MPVHSCQSNGKSGFKWGGSGKCYTYNPNDKSSKERARKKAIAQGRAAHASGYKSTDVSKQSSKVQSLIFKKPKFNISKAKSWAKSHGFKSGNTRQTENTIRLQQFKPELCTRSGGMKELDDGVMGYICPISNIEKLSILTRDIQSTAELIRKQPSRVHIYELTKDETSKELPEPLIIIDKKTEEEPEPSGSTDEEPREGVPGSEVLESKSKDSINLTNLDIILKNYSIPNSMDEISEGHVLKFKDKIGIVKRIIKVE